MTRRRAARRTVRRRTPRRRVVERFVIWGGAAVVVVVLCQLGLHPAAAALLGITAAMLIAGMLTAAGQL